MTKYRSYLLFIRKGNVAQLKWSFGMGEDLGLEQQRLEERGQDIVNSSVDDPEKMATRLVAHSNEIVSDFNDFVYTLLFRYADGYKNYWDEKADTFISASQGYPAW